MSRGSWDALEARERYLLRVRAVAETRRFRPVLSHWSAAAVHGLPIVGDWPVLVHIAVGPTTGGRSRNGVVKHSVRLRDGDVEEIDGLLTTSLARTVVDLAASSSPLSAVAVVDYALHIDRHARRPAPLHRDRLLEMWESMMPFRGHARSLDLIEFGETAADSPLESVSRFTMRAIGCPRPRLQTPFFDREGFIGETDFDWPDFGHIGEADGDRKYLDEAYRRGRTPERVVLDEKFREDRLRAVSKGFTRWRWVVARDPRALRVLLSEAGLPMGVPWV